MTGALTIVTPPTEEPVTQDEVIDHLRIDATDVEDTLLPIYISAVRRWIERLAGIAFISQTLEWARDFFPPTGLTYGLTRMGYPPIGSDIWESDAFGSIILPRPPLISVTSVTYVDGSGATQTLATNQYQVDTRSYPGRIAPAYGVSWPDTRWQPNAVVVRYVAGYTDAASVPEDLKQVVLLACGMLYENREELIDGSLNATGILKRLLANHRAWVTT